MSRRWYKRCGADFIHGTMMLTLEQKGAYSLCLDLIYDRGGPIPDDARWLSGVCGVSIRKWNGIRETLIELGKLYAKDGSISNVRADFELVSAELSSRERAESGAKGGRKRAENAATNSENNDLGEAELKQPQKQIREDKIREESKGSDADASGAVAPLPQPIDLKATVFNSGAALLVSKGVKSDRDARSLLGRLRSKYGDAPVIDALAALQRASPSDVAPYLVEILETRYGQRNGLRGTRPDPGLDLARRGAALEAQESAGRDPEADWRARPTLPAIGQG